MEVAESWRRIVLIGGAGVFGQRLAALLAAQGDYDVIVAARDVARAQSQVSALGLRALKMDRRAVTAQDFLALNAWCVIDASGPFETTGADPYRVAIQAAKAGAHYVDLADGRDFVEGFGALDATAKAAGRALICGASSTPALSSAVCDDMRVAFAQIDRIEIAISPGNRAPRGLAVVRSILGYAGKPVRIWRAGRWESDYGWGLLTRKTVAPTLEGRWLSLCDVADLGLFPGRYAVRDTVLFRGGLELGALHLGLYAASLLVRWRVLPRLTLFAEAARDLADALILLGGDRGGMMVEMSGADANGAALRRTWSLLAEAGDGPNVPVLAAFAIVNKLDRLPPGAGPCVGTLTLADFAPLFARFRIQTCTD